MLFPDWTRENCADPRLARGLEAVAACAMPISRQLRRAALTGAQGAVGTVNVQGEEQKALDVFANEVFIEKAEAAQVFSVLVSEELETVSPVARADSEARFALVFDPLDGSSNLEVNGAVGSIFSVLEVGRGATSEAAVLAASGKQLAAGYVLYGPATVLVLTTGKAVALFALDEVEGVFSLVNPSLTIPAEASEFSINASRRRAWYAATRDFIDNCLAGKSGPYAKSYNMRWCAAMVADMHRILTRGGIFLYPEDEETRAKGGRLRFLYEANPMALLIETAGGAASTGRERLLDVTPTALHQRIGVIAGSRAEVERATSLYGE